VHVRRCPSCREEYRPDVSACVECGEALEDWDDEAAGGETPESAADEEEEDLSGFEPLFSAGIVSELTPLADRLIAAGIECRIRDVRRGSHVHGYRLLVPSEGAARALEMTRSLTGAETGVSVLRGTEAGFDPERGYDSCPACGAPLQAGAHECAECGLPLAAPEGVACPSCGQVLEPDAGGRCGNCGQVLDE
jgi:predicted amidophosphoribosyltransferase